MIFKKKKNYKLKKEEIEIINTVIAVTNESDIIKLQSNCCLRNFYQRSWPSNSTHCGL